MECLVALATANFPEADLSKPAAKAPVAAAPKAPAAAPKKEEVKKLGVASNPFLKNEEKKKEEPPPKPKPIP